MSGEFSELVSDMQPKVNGNGAPMHDNDWFRKELLPTIGRYVESRVKPLRQRIDELERKTENWEYRGVYESGQTYFKNNFTTFDGSLWICLCSTVTAPGTDETWQLCVKRGKNGKDFTDPPKRLPTSGGPRGQQEQRPAQ